MTPEFFYEPNVETLVFERGDHSYYLRMARALRLHLQFDTVNESPISVVRFMREAMGFVGQKAHENGYKELIFETTNTDLAAFCKRGLGFRASPHEYVVHI